MSAICGIVGLGEHPVPEHSLERMMRALEQHGPDGRGYWRGDSVALGHQMMHVAPESLNEQLPFYESESRIAVTSNARLDNRADLLESLELPPLSEMPDSRLILESYKKWGTACAERLIGEFAFCIWDDRDRSLHCFTDPMGIRPLFYTEVPGKYFAVASEVAPLLRLGDTPLPVNERRLAMLGVSALTVYLEPETTCFQGLRRVPPATVLSVTNTTRRAHEYWRPEITARLDFKSDAECREAFQEVFFAAVRPRLRSAFPVASMLSGGLDSSGIVGVASRLLAAGNESLMTLSIVPMPSARGQVADETEFIERFRETPNLEMRYVSAPEQGPFDDLEHLVQSASLCSYSYQHFLYTALIRAARKGNARSILDGHGGEYSASCDPRGYLAELLLAAKWKTLIRELRSLDAKDRIKWRPVKSSVLRPLFPYSLLKLLNRHRQYENLIEFPVRPDFVQDVLGRDMFRIRDRLFRALEDYPDHRKNMASDTVYQQRDLRQRSHAGFVDYQNAELSYPYLDRRVLEFALAVDGRFKYQEGRSRRLLRLGLDGLLPRAILERNSKGPFSPDYFLRFQRDKTRAASDLRVFHDSRKLRHIVDFDKVMPALDESPIYSREKPMRVDYHSQFLIPYAMYLCYFLQAHTSQEQPRGTR